MDAELPFVAAAENAAEALEEMGGDWKLRFFEPLLEHPEVSPRISGELENLIVDFDLALDAIVEKLRDCSLSVGS
jgi:hypothetical protein